MNMQNRIKSWAAFLMACLIILTGFGFTACKKEKVETKIVLESFGPSPALRGGELRFIGLNLEKVTSIILPGLKEGQTVEVSEITVIDEREIQISIPQEAGVGYVTLKTPEGDITSITLLTFSEPIMIESVKPTTIKAGETLTVTGDYLNLIKEITFFDGVSIGDTAFISQSRKKIEVAVPAEAQTGKIILSNGEEIPIEVYSQDPVNIVLPTLTSFTPTTIKPGDVLTITGKDLDLVSMVEFGGGKIIPTFTLNPEGTKITIEVPEDAQEGVVKLIAKSGVYVEGTGELKLVMPSNLTVTPTAVRNNGTMTITGKDLDLVSTVMFGDLEAEITEKTAEKITLTVPETASATTATLNMLSTQTVETPEFTYVAPTIATMTPETIMAGTELTITGTNLDLVKQVKFTGSDNIVDVSPTSATSIALDVPADALTGTVTLITLNDTEIASPTELTVTAADIPVITDMPTSIKPGSLLVIEGTKLNLVETVIFENGVKATNFGTRSATLLEVYVPEEVARGVNDIQLITFTDKTVTAPITISGVDPILPTTVMIYDFNQRTSDWHAVDWDNWGSSYDADLGKANGYITLVSRPGWWVLGCNHPDPDNGWPSVDPTKYVLKVDIKTETPITITGDYQFKFRIGGEDVSSKLLVTNNQIVTPGNDWATVTIPIDGILSNPTIDSGEFGIILDYSDDGTDFAGLSFDNLRFDLK